MDWTTALTLICSFSDGNLEGFHISTIEGNCIRLKREVLLGDLNNWNGSFEATLVLAVLSWSVNAPRLLSIVLFFRLWKWYLSMGAPCDHCNLLGWINNGFAYIRTIRPSTVWKWKFKSIQKAPLLVHIAHKSNRSLQCNWPVIFENTETLIIRTFCNLLSVL